MSSSFDPNLQDILADLEDSINRMKSPSGPSSSSAAAQQRSVPSSTSSTPNRPQDPELVNRINTLKKLKEQAIMNEDYEGAARYKADLEELQRGSSSSSTPSHQSETITSSRDRQQSYLAEPEFKASEDPSVIFGRRTAASVSEGTATPQAKPTPHASVTPTPTPVSPSAAKIVPKSNAPPENAKLVLEAFGGRYNNVVKMLDEGAYVDSVDFNTGNTALIAAAEPGHTQLIKLLVDRGANVNLKNRRGRTALHYTIERRYDDITMFLVEVARADLEVPDNLGMTSLSLASTIPQLHSDLRILQDKNKKELVAEKIAESSESTGEVTIYLRNKGFPIQIGSANTAGQVSAAMAKILKLEDIVKDLQIVEDAMGKEKPLEDNEILLMAQGKWSNKNPKYFKFSLKVKRGSNSASQMKFREVMYAQG